MATPRLGTRQLKALEMVAKHDGEKFSFPWRLSRSQANAFGDRLRRLQELGLIEDFTTMAYLTTLDGLMAGGLLGKPVAWRATLTPAGQDLLNNKESAA